MLPRHLQIEQLAERLRLLSTEVREAVEIVGDHASWPLRGSEPVRVAKALLNMRRRRSAMISDIDLFRNPAWDIMLDLLISEREGREVSVSSACIASGVPSTTALRYLAKLRKEGLIEERPDPWDRRRRYVELTQKGTELLISVLTPERLASSP
jgi:DNA-binding MarR family transcriptional regulator